MFKKHKPKPAQVNGDNNNVLKTRAAPVPAVPAVQSVRREELQFQCQLSHGSPTTFLSGFSNVKELYKRIADAFDFPASEILFCTLNTFKIDMKKLLGGQIGLEDMIFVHKKGRPKEVELTKTEDSLGLTITDNGDGYAFIKRIKEGSVIDSIKHIQVGDHVEKLNGESMVGKRHYEVAKALKQIPTGSTFTIRLVEPLKSGFNNIAPKSSKYSKKAGLGTGRETLRFKANGDAEIKEQDDTMDAGIDKINGILESFMGINDNELATQIWEMANGKENSMDFAEAIDDSDLASFQFSDDLIIELWGVITDARSGR